jgi:hypothetical protein
MFSVSLLPFHYSRSWSLFCCLYVEAKAVINYRWLFLTFSINTCRIACTIILVCILWQNLKCLGGWEILGLCSFSIDKGTARLVQWRGSTWIWVPLSSAVLVSSWFTKCQQQEEFEVGKQYSQWYSSGCFPLRGLPRNLSFNI